MVFLNRIFIFSNIWYNIVNKIFILYLQKGASMFDLDFILKALSILVPVLLVIIIITQAT